MRDHSLTGHATEVRVKPKDAVGHDLDDTDPKISELNTEILSLKEQVNNANMEGNVISLY